MLVEMLATAACPNFVFQAGKVYNIPRHLAERFIKGSNDLVYAREVSAATSPKPTRIPSQPDPEDSPVAVDEDDDVSED